MEGCPLWQMEHGAILAMKGKGLRNKDHSAVKGRLWGQATAPVMVTLGTRASESLPASGLLCLSLCPGMSLKLIHDRNHEGVQREGPPCQL